MDDRAGDPVRAARQRYPAEMLRIVIGHPGNDDEPGEVVMLARGLRDAGHEVIHAGPQEAVEALAAAAVQEDADVVALVLDPADEGDVLGRMRDTLASLADEEIDVVAAEGWREVLARVEGP